MIDLSSRDKLVADIIAYFDSDKFLVKDAKNPDDLRLRRLGLLSPSDAKIIESELLKCSEDYRYAAGNYFCISDKDGNDQLMSLWDGQELLLQRMEDMKARGKPQLVIAIKARQLGLSMFGCSMVFWNSVFKRNKKGLIVSEDLVQSQNLFSSYLSPLYRQLPWWLKPQSSVFKEDGIVFDKPAKEGGMGLNSSIAVQWASRKGGLGQGYKLNAFHGSEFTAWDNLAESLEQDLKYALVRQPSTIGILESTAKGAGTPSHAFYNKCEALAEQSDWEAVFLPYFFEKTRVMAPRKGWRPEKEDLRMREVVYANWTVCDNKKCLRYVNRKSSTGVRDGEKCPSCKIGTLGPYTLTDEQIYFMVNERLNSSAQRNIDQELALTVEEAFVAEGEQVFSKQSIKALEYMVQTANPPLPGFMDKHGFFHGYREDDLDRKCHLDGCKIWHGGEIQNIRVWEKPRTGESYQIGADIGYGKGKDYSVATVIRVGRSGGRDYQCATLRSNIIEPLEFAYLIAKLAKWYNEAQVAIEYNTPGNSTADHLAKVLNYPNIYRERATNSTLHWVTNQKSKPKIIITLDRWLKEEIFIARDKLLLDEIKVFTKAVDSVSTGAEQGFNDDCLMSAMIALYTAHAGDYEDNLGIVPQKIDKDPTTCLYRMDCTACHKMWGSDNPRMMDNCPFCKSMMIRATRNMSVQMDTSSDYRESSMFTPDMLDVYSKNDSHWYEPSYESL